VGVSFGQESWRGHCGTEWICVGEPGGGDGGIGNGQRIRVGIQ
jgi:hypothetical protein